MTESRHLNFFRPFERLPAHHENQLTRALLVVLDKVPLAHSAWLRLVDSGYRGAEPSGVGALEDLPSPIRVLTQQGSLENLAPPEGAAEVTAEERPRLLSVVQSAELVDAEADVLSEDRSMVLDGVIYYGERLAIVIESKLDQPASDVQYTRIDAPGWRVDARPATVRWRDTIAAWRGLVEADLLGYAEQRLMLDFLWFVEEHFPSLQPFSKLALCKGNSYLACMRCEAILAEVGDGPTVTEHGRWRARLELQGAKTVRYAYLVTGDADSTIELWMYPGDDLGQARALYGRPPGVRALTELAGWDVQPNMHFGFMQSGFAWSETPCPLSDYVEYWINHIGSAGQVDRPDWDDYIGELVGGGVLSEDGREAFAHAFIESERQRATPRPGLVLVYRWPFDQAADLDAEGRFAPELRTRLHEVLDLLEEPHP